MKKILAFLVLASVAFQGALLAGVVEGTVASVDTAAKSISVTLADGSSSDVSYSDTTTWPADVTDPATLAGKSVTITTDDATGAAVSVE